MRRTLTILPGILLSGCSGVQAMSEGAGYGSHLFNRLMVLFLVVTCVAYALVIGFLAVALVRRREPGRPALARPMLIGWIAFIVVGLVALTLASFLSDRSEAQIAANRAPLRVTVNANQWWWAIEYESDDAARTLRTANELHLPVGRPVEIKLNSGDVIHSLWIPALAGKQDLIPGRSNDLKIVPLRIGHYRSQCAEFCGLQHAHMAIDVTVESPRDFAAWYGAQLQPAAAPTTPLARAGHDWFVSHPCANCHAIVGTEANGTTGPDLTHVASRRAIAAGTLPMSRGNLMGWIANPQAVKPGARMPVVPMSGDDLQALGAYLETLK